MTRAERQGGIQVLELHAGEAQLLVLIQEQAYKAKSEVSLGAAHPCRVPVGSELHLTSAGQQPQPPSATFGVM
jgi:hypothetical protein